VNTDPGHVDIRHETYGGPIARPLTDALAAELEARYDESGPGPEPPPSDFEDPLGAFLVAYVDDVPAGCGGVCPYEGTTGEIRRMYVVPEFRRRGISRAILGTLEAEAKRLGYTVLRLETGPQQPESIALYAKAGYGPIPRYGHWTTFRRSMCFEKPL
jgi:GNAT superfamily N-acetyltransferase